MAIPAGTRIGPYEVQHLAGAGGMGEVYAAHDPRIGRQVAIKVLPAIFSHDPDRLYRFEQEIRAVGMINHPNILTIYDVGTHDGSPYVVSELLDGETLRQRMAGEPLPFRKAIEYAQQTAHGLVAAHEKGIVHRDLKPENLFVTHDGRVKILDFGLAKLIQPDQAHLMQTDVPTTPAQTELGKVMGTVGYMSPEQVRGLPADHRSDIFAFGTILYEILSGRRAFRGGSTVETLNAILKEDPPELAVAGRNLPDAVERVVRHCLEKNPEERFQSARDLAFDLESTTIASMEPRALAPTRTGRRLWPALAGLALLALVGAGALVAMRVANEPLPSYRQLTFRRGTVWAARFAPDGQTIVYGAAWEGRPIRLFSTRLESPESHALDLPDADLMAVSASGELAISLGRKFDASGGVAVYNLLGTLARVPLGGGAPREVLENVHDADWSSGGSTLAVVRKMGPRNRLEYPVGTVLYESAGWISHARVSPTAERVAFIDHPRVDDFGSVVVVDRAGSKRVLSPDWFSIQGLAWAPDGREVWFTGTEFGGNSALHAVDLLGRRRLIARAPGRLTLHDIFTDGRVLLTRDTIRAGIIALPPGETKDRDLSWFDFSIVTDLSADGGRLVLSESGEGVKSTFVIYLRNTDGSPAVRLGEAFQAVLSPDGRSVAAILQTSTPQLAVWPTGAGEPRLLPRHGLEAYVFATWFPDGKRLLFSGNEPGHGVRTYIQDLDGGKPRAMTPEGVRFEYGNPISPDGRMVAAVGPDQKSSLYTVEGTTVRPLPALEPGDQTVRWSADGHALYVYRPGDVPLKIYRLDLTTGRKALWKQVTPPDPAGVVGIPWFLPTPDGRSYAYSYFRVLSDLFLVEGLR